MSTVTLPAKRWLGQSADRKVTVMKTLCSLVLLLVVTSTHAQDCGGMANAGGTCVPPDVAMPSYQQQAPQPPPKKWVDHYGAIAVDGDKGLVGISTDASSYQQAEQLAQMDCISKGGAACKIQISYRNQCVAMIIGNNGKLFNTNDDPTVDTAAQNGMQMCMPEAHDCHVYYSACSLPVRIQ